MRQEAWSTVQLLICSRERNKDVYIHTTWSPSERQQHRESGVVKLAYSSNCYSFTLAPFPSALSPHVRCVHYISQHARAYAARTTDGYQAAL